MKQRIIFVFCLFLSSVCLPVFAGEVDIDNDGSVTWQAGIDGINIEWAPDGSIKRIYSRGSAPVEFADRRGIAKGLIIAEEKAKANIIRFMEQSSSSTRVITEVQTDLNKATQTRETGKSRNVKKVDERTVMESLTEVTSSFASGTLRGVIVLEQGYDEKLEEAWAAVGISKKTIAASSAMETMLNDADEPQRGNNNQRKGEIEQRGEVRKTTQKDW